MDNEFAPTPRMLVFKGRRLGGANPRHKYLARGGAPGHYWYVYGEENLVKLNRIKKEVEARVGFLKDTLLDVQAGLKGAVLVEREDRYAKIDKIYDELDSLKEFSKFLNVHITNHTARPKAPIPPTGKSLLDSVSEGTLIDEGQADEGIHGVHFKRCPDGTKVVERDYEAPAEMLMYRLSQALGYGDLIPEGVIYNGCTYQRFLPHMTMAGVYKGSSGYAQYSKVATSPRGRQLAVLDFISCNGDRHDWNWLIDKKGSPYGIDHEFSFGYDHLRDGYVRSMPWSEICMSDPRLTKEEARHIYKAVTEFVKDPANDDLFIQRAQHDDTYADEWYDAPLEKRANMLKKMIAKRARLLYRAGTFAIRRNEVPPGWQGK